MTGYYTTPADLYTTISSNVYLIKTDSAGTLEWEQNFGGPAHDIGYGVAPMVDASYVVIGCTRSFDGNEADNLWIRTAAPAKK